MRTKPLISLSAATGLVDAIRSAGGDPDRILRARGLDSSTVSNPDGFISCADFAEILEEAARTTGEDCFGLHFGERYNPKNLGPLTYVALNSPTFAAAFGNIARYLGVHNEAARVSFNLEGGWVYARHSIGDLGIAARQHHECAMAAGLNLIRLMAGSQWAPVEVQFAHKAPAETAEHLRVFRAPVSFEHAANAFVMDRELLERSVPAADERLYPVLKRYLDRALQEMPRESSLLVSVRRAVGESLREGDPTLGNVAARLGVNARTLQRQLSEQPMDFKGLVDDTRRRFAQTYLRDRKETLTEIAFLLGYSEVSAFNRAFRRWTGSTPSDYRRRQTARKGAAPLRSRRPRSRPGPGGV